MPAKKLMIIVLLTLGVLISLLFFLRFLSEKAGLTVKDRTVVVTSQIPNVSLKLADRKLFLKKLETIKFWDNGKVADLRRQQEKYKAKEIVIVLTQASLVPDPYFVNTDGNSRPLFAFGSSVDRLGLVTFYIGLDDIYLLPKNSQATENLINALILDGAQIIANSQHLSTRNLEQVTSISAPRYFELNIKL